MRLGLYRLFLGCLLFQCAIKREASFIVTVNKTIRGRSSRVPRKISFQGSAYQRSWKVLKDCEGPATFPPPSSHNVALSLWIRITVANLTLALHSCYKINKSITFPHTWTASVTTQVKIVSSHMPVSLLNIPPSMPKLLESTWVTIVSQCWWSAHMVIKCHQLECGKGKALSLHKPLAEQKAVWVVGVLYKANVANSGEEDLKPENSSSTVISRL